MTTGPRKSRKQRNDGFQFQTFGFGRIIYIDPNFGFVSKLGGNMTSHAQRMRDFQGRIGFVHTHSRVDTTSTDGVVLKLYNTVVVSLYSDRSACQWRTVNRSMLTADF